MTAIAFVGPTLHGSKMEWPAGVERRPPAALGDIARATRERPRAIALIDGRFGDAPSVWHREILEALSHGIPVLGGGSLGAIRAAELHSFGMIGVGEIFVGYANGTITRDDAVLVLQGPAEIGAPPVTVALVDAEATVRNLAASAAVRTHLLRIARRLKYYERTYHRMCCLYAYAADFIDADELENALITNAVSKKQLDAEQLLHQLVYGSITLKHTPEFISTTHYEAALASVKPLVSN